MEELINVDKIIRPAYKSIGDKRTYEPLKDRGVGRLTDHNENQNLLTSQEN